MKTKLMKSCFALFLLAGVIIPASAQDSWKIWTSAASTGTVDESDVNKIIFSGPGVLFNPAAGEGTATIRYNVVAVDGLFANLTPTSWPALIVRYRDNGPNERVVVRLKELVLGVGVNAIGDFGGPGEGNIKTLITLDSNDYPQINDAQSQSIGNCGQFGQFVFAAPNIVRVYYLEVEITKGGTSGAPRLGGLAITRYGVCPNGVLQQH
ncbi:MAG: hypothetical protein M3X11_01935 [Acidobacteriota bacterium]|nr:hypothetical protein [Acidobacteriota bacterium]